MHVFTVLTHFLLLLLAVPTIAACLYLLFLTIFSAQLKPPRTSRRELRFDVIVPAHNESAVIQSCLASLMALDWPLDRFRILVVADNCDDATARLAANAGAQVLVRRDPDLVGKGHALNLAFDHCVDAAFADALVVVDADTQVSSNLLEAFATRIEAGAGVIQAHYGVRNPDESWRSSLMAIAYGAFHGVRSRARERLGLSSGLRGNGWCITSRALESVPYRAFSLTEDLEYGIMLGLAGHRVHYAHEAFVDAEMAVDEQVARRQRQRWEDGRFDLLRAQLAPLLSTVIARRSAVALDLAADLLVLPLSYIAMSVIALGVAGGAAALWLPSALVWVAAAAFCAMCLTLYVLRGWQLSGRGVTGLFDLLRAPGFLLWRLVRVLRPHDREEWAPTRKKGP